MKVSSETSRRHALRGVVTNWKYKPPQDATGTIDSAEISDELKEELLGILKKEENANELIDE